LHGGSWEGLVQCVGEPDREIRIDNGWTVKIGRGLDFFQV
jgi:Phospholipase D-like domain at C-terminus of MIT